MSPHLLVFPDFHIRGASAPEWNQRYLQMSPGVMRSTLLEWSAGGVHVFRKWMSQRVVQQGGLPRGQLCFALLGRAAPAGVRMQGREFHAGDLLVLRGGQEFEIQRPAGVELLSVTFDAQRFSEFLDIAHAPVEVRRLTAGTVIRTDIAVLEALLRRIRTPDADELMRAMHDVLVHATAAPRERAAGVAAARVVTAASAITLAAAGEQPLRVDELCARLRISRRTLQGSFNRVAGTNPVAYLRNMRLNLVRRRLMTTPRAALSVSAAAMDAGFDHLGRFAGNYKALFGESPSKTARLDR